MLVTLWGTRGSLPSPGQETVRYGGNTACVEVEVEGAAIILDAGTGIRELGVRLQGQRQRIDILLSHLHVDHIQGLGFFAPLFEAHREVHIWGPVSTTLGLRARLARYLSPPLFPVPIRELPSDLVLHDLPLDSFQIGAVEISAQLICHPGPTVGYRLTDGRSALTYIPDHEPALGAREFPGPPDWISGLGLARDCDLLIHDAQYLEEEYDDHVGWGHSTIPHTLAFAALAGVRKLVTFHHDPWHSDDLLDQALATGIKRFRPKFEVVLGAEGATFEV